jgi:hypothetical protein
MWVAGPAHSPFYWRGRVQGDGLGSGAGVDRCRQGQAGCRGCPLVVGEVSALVRLDVHLVTMTGNVAQAIADPEAWEATLRGVYEVLRPDGCLVFETRNTAVRAWEEWTRDRTRQVIDVEGVGEVEKWTELKEVALPWCVSERPSFSAKVETC